MSGTIGFIFARGGSKGLPGKNVRPLAGKPLVGRAVESALNARSIDRVIISSDDQAIIDTAVRFGAEAPFVRPSELAGDRTPEWLAWRHAIETIRKIDGPSAVSTFVSIPATAPLRLPSDIDRCVARLHETSADVAITVTEAHRNPWFNMITTDEHGLARLVMSGPGITRRQDAPPVYDMTTIAYALRPDFILQANGLFEGRVTHITVPPERSLDIDTELDFEMAEFLFPKLFPEARPS